MPDYRGKECYECQEKFTALRRRHHCRICGQIFCSRCCNQEIPGRFLGYMGNLRLCNYCCNAVTVFLEKESGTKQSENRELVPAGALLSPDAASQSSVAVISSSNSTAWPGLHSAGGKKAASAREPALSSLSVQELIVDAPECLTKSADPSPPDEWEPDWVKNIEVNSTADSSFGSDSFSRRTHSEADRDDVDLEDGGVRASPVRSTKGSTPIRVQSRESSDGRPIAYSVPVMPLFPSESLPRATVSPQPSLDRKSESGSVCSAADSHQDFDQLFEQKALRLLEYLLMRDHLHLDSWKAVLWPLIKKVGFL